MFDRVYAASRADVVYANAITQGQGAYFKLYTVIRKRMENSRYGAASVATEWIPDHLGRIHIDNPRSSHTGLTGYTGMKTLIPDRLFHAVGEMPSCGTRLKVQPA